MKTSAEYRPEDIEALLKSKSFDELYEEEKSFVLKHLSSAAEYELLRKTFHHIHTSIGDDADEDFLPPPQLKENLVSAFRAQRATAPAFRLNQVLLFLRDVVNPRRPAFVYALGVIVLLIGLLWWFHPAEPSKSSAPVFVKNDTSKTIPSPAPVPNQTPDQSPQQIAPQQIVPQNNSVAQQPLQPHQATPNNVDTVSTPNVVASAQSRSLAEDQSLAQFFYEAL